MRLIWYNKPMKILLPLLFSLQIMAIDTSAITENAQKLGISPEAISAALCFHKKHSGKTKFSKKIGGKLTSSTKITNDNYLVVQDFTQTSREQRFYLVNLETSEVRSYYSAHGSGNLSGKFNWPVFAEYFSNDNGSNLTPQGFMISGERAQSKRGWKWTMKFDGIEAGLNDNSRDREIVFHPGVGSSDWEDNRVDQGYTSSNDMIDTSGIGLNFFYMSSGCTMVSKYHAEEIYELTKKGTLFYNFTQELKDKGSDYCGSENYLLLNT